MRFALFLPPQANEMWRLWTAFFDRLVVEADVRATAPAR